MCGKSRWRSVRWHHVPLFLFRTTASTENKISPNQMHEKHTTCEVVNGSPKTTTPKSSCNEGDRYCMKPIVDSGMRSAALPNHSSGTAVTTPPKARSTMHLLTKSELREPTELWKVPISLLRSQQYIA